MRFLFTALLLTIASLYSGISAQLTVPADTTEARQIITVLASYLNSQSGQERIEKQIGSTISVRATVDNDALVYTYDVGDFQVNNPDDMRELTRISIASGRGDEARTHNMVMLCDLLKVAGYNFRTVYVDNDSLTCSLEFSPVEFKELLTKPIDDLNLNYEAALKQLMVNMQNNLTKEQESTEELIYAKLRRDGDYLTFELGMEDERAEPIIKARTIDHALVGTIINEAIGNSTAFLLNNTVNIGRLLGLKGFKLDLRSPSGLQKVINIPWDDFLAALSNPSATPVTDLFVAAVRDGLSSTVSDPDNGVTEAYVRYNAPDIEILLRLDTDDLSQRNMAEEKAQWMVNTIDDDFIDTVNRLVDEGVESLRYIYTDRDGTDRRVMEVTLKEIIDFGSKNL